MTDDDKLRRAQRAAQIMADEMVAGAFAEVERAITAAWQTAPYNDTAGRERLFQQLKASHAFKAVFEEALREGEVAKHRIEQVRAHG